ncbi:class I SAM-dependent methyltransferase [candidate division KSB1 bacterium]|nr:class I SAM-dependent methyltransferase [candidate division KSB1 bacterium]
MKSNFVEKNRKFWNRRAAGYDRQVLKLYGKAYALSIEKAVEALTPTEHVLEIGCGTGIVTLDVAPHVGHLVAVDVASEMVRLAEEKAAARDLRNCEFHVADGESLEFADSAFDAVLLFNTLHAVADPQALLCEIHRVLKPGGKLLCATDCYGDPAPFGTALRLRLFKPLIRLRILPHFFYFTRDDIDRLLVKNGFSLRTCDILHPAPVNYYVQAEKID